MDWEGVSCGGACVGALVDDEVVANLNKEDVLEPPQSRRGLKKSRRMI